VNTTWDAPTRQTGCIHPAFSAASGQTRKSASTERSQPGAVGVICVFSGSGIKLSAAGSPSPPTMPSTRFVPVRHSRTAGTPLLPCRMPWTVKQGALA